jgi:hypothetical protein
VTDWTAIGTLWEGRAIGTTGWAGVGWLVGVWGCTAWGWGESVRSRQPAEASEMRPMAATRGVEKREIFMVLSLVGSPAL